MTWCFLDIMVPLMQLLLLFMMVDISGCLVVTKGMLDVTIIPAVNTCKISWTLNGKKSGENIKYFTLWSRTDAPDSSTELHELKNSTHNFIKTALHPGQLSQFLIRISYGQNEYADTDWIECRTLVPVESITLETQDKSMTVVAGNLIHAECSTSGSLPASSITWYIEDYNVTKHSIATVTQANDGYSFITNSTLNITAKKHFNQKKITCVARNIEGEHRHSDTYVLNVLYPPDVRVTIPSAKEHQRSVRMKCHAFGGNPDVYNYTGWTHYYNGKYIRKFGGLGVGRELILQDLSYEDIGNYKCYVSINTQEGSRFVTKGLGTLEVAVTPKIFPYQSIYTAPLGGNITVGIPFLLFNDTPPSYTDVQWRNMTDNSLLQNSIFVTQKIHVLTFNITMHGQAVDWHGYRAELQITNLQDCHYGEYRLTVKNSIGYTNSTITIGNVNRQHEGRVWRFKSIVLAGVGAGCAFLLCLIISVIIYCKVVSRNKRRASDGIVGTHGSVKSHQSLQRNQSQHDSATLQSDPDGYVTPIASTAYMFRVDNEDSDHTYEVPTPDTRPQPPRRPFNGF